MTAFDEGQFTLGWTHAENSGSIPKTASRDFLEGYIANLAEKTGEKAPGYDTVSPAFEAPNPLVNNSQSDYTDATPAKDHGDYEGIRSDLAHKVDADNAKGQSRSDGSMTDLSGWKTSALLREIAIRTSALDI